MDRELLDIDLVEGQEKDPQPSMLNWIAVIVLWAGLVLCIVFGFYDLKIFAAVVSLAIVSIISKRNFKLGVKLVFVVVLAGIFDLVTFFPVYYSISIFFGENEISFNVLLILIGLLHFYMNRAFLGYAPSDQNEEENRPIHNPNENRSSINGFKRRFLKKEIDELEFILQNDKMVPEARIAAKELISEKSQTA